ncbi:MAG: hypothetical protein ACTS5A_02890 [Candidatus Hodgkinia cicadicola]
MLKGFGSYITSVVRESSRARAREVEIYVIVHERKWLFRLCLAAREGR